MPKAEPQRGEVWIVDTGYAGKIRPCVVLSVPAEDQDRALITYIPCTSSGRGSRFEANINASFLQKPGVVNAQGIATIDHNKFQRKLGLLSSAQLAEVEVVVKHWLGFDLSQI